MSLVDCQQELLLPTEAKERARKKALKEAGTPHVPQKKPKVVEDHYDDCGEDLSSLKGIDLNSHTNEYAVLSDHWANRLYVTDEDSDDEEEESFLKNVQLFVFCYTGYDLTKNLKLAVMSNIEQLSFVVDRRSYTHLIAKICGGEARATR